MITFILLEFAWALIVVVAEGQSATIKFDTPYSEYASSTNNMSEANKISDDSSINNKPTTSPNGNNHVNKVMAEQQKDGGNNKKNKPPDQFTNDTKLQWVSHEGTSLELSWNSKRKWGWKKKTRGWTPYLEVWIEIPKHLTLTVGEGDAARIESKGDTVYFVAEMRSLSAAFSVYEVTAETSNRSGLLINVQQPAPYILQHETCINEGVTLSNLEILQSASSVLYASVYCDRAPDGALNVEVISSVDGLTQKTDEHYDGSYKSLTPYRLFFADIEKRDKLPTVFLLDESGNKKISYQLTHEILPVPRETLPEIPETIVDVDVWKVKRYHPFVRDLSRLEIGEDNRYLNAFGVGLGIRSQTARLFKDEIFESSAALFVELKSKTIASPRWLTLQIILPGPITSPKPQLSPASYRHSELRLYGSNIISGHRFFIEPGLHLVLVEYDRQQSELLGGLEVGLRSIISDEFSSRLSATKYQLSRNNLLSNLNVETKLVYQSVSLPIVDQLFMVVHYDKLILPESLVESYGLMIGGKVWHNF